MNKSDRIPLKSGGELVVYESGFRIEYFFAGPDGRYGGVHVNIPGSRVGEYLAAWQENFERLESLRNESRGINRKTVKAEVGVCGMMIRTGIGTGVYLQGNHMRITTREQLAQVIEDYEYALRRGSQSLPDKAPETNRQCQ